jgi:hypothetical protein
LTYNDIRHIVEVIVSEKLKILEKPFESDKLILTEEGARKEHYE